MSERPDLVRAKASIDEFILIQKDFLNISLNTFENVTNSILSYKFWNNESENEEFIHLLVHSVDIRPRSTKLYIEVVKRIIKIHSCILPLIKNILLSTFERKTRRIFFLYLLVKDNLIMITEVINFINQMFNDKAFKYMKLHRKYCLTMFCWFMPEMEKNDLNKFEEYINLLKSTHKSPYFRELGNVNIPFLNQYELLKNNDWELFKKYREEGTNPNDIAMAIENDEIRDYGDINGVIEPSLFECCGFINHYPTLLQYAAFFGSVNSFNYLLKKGADSSLLDKKNRKLEDYAIAGGNNEIISIVFNSNFSISEAPFYQNIPQVSRTNIIQRRRINDIGAERTFSSCKNRFMKNHTKIINKTNIQQSEYNQVESKDTNDNGYSNMMVAKFNRFGVIKPNFNESVFFKACKLNCIELVIYAVENGININCVDSYNNYPITYAAQYGNVDLVKFLSYLDDVNLSAIDSTVFFIFLAFTFFSWNSLSSCCLLWSSPCCKISH